MNDSSPPQYTRPSLLLRIRDAADREAWETFVDVYAPLVYRFARRKGLQDADAADLTQDVMGEVARSIREFEYQRERGKFRNWLLLITRRRWIRVIARHARRAEELGARDFLLDDQEFAPDPEWDEAFNRRVLDVALRRIQPDFEPRTWRVFERVWLEDRSAAEAAEELSVGIQVIYKAKSRVLRRLEEEIREIMEDFSWLDGLEMR